MVRCISYCLPLLLFLHGCGGPGRPRAPRHVDSDGNEISNLWTVAADWFFGFGCVAILVGILLIIFLKMLKTGGLTILAGFAFFMFAQILSSIGEHIVAYSIFFVACLLTCSYLYIKAITVGIPWLEKLLDKDLNNDGHKGTNKEESPALEPQDIVEPDVDSTPSGNNNNG